MFLVNKIAKKSFSSSKRCRKEKQLVYHFKFQLGEVVKHPDSGFVGSIHGAIVSESGPFKYIVKPPGITKLGKPRDEEIFEQNELIYSSFSNASRKFAHTFDFPLGSVVECKHSKLKGKIKTAVVYPDTTRYYMQPEGLTEEGKPKEILSFCPYDLSLVKKTKSAPK